MKSKNKPRREQKKKKVRIDFGTPCPPTKKQMEFIREIEVFVWDPFMGETIEEATEYISQHIDQYRRNRYLDQLDLDDDVFVAPDEREVRG